MVPKDEDEFQHMMKTAIECPMPVAFRYPRGRGVGVRRETLLQSIDIGKGEVLREGERHSHLGDRVHRLSLPPCSREIGGSWDSFGCDQ